MKAKKIMGINFIGPSELSAISRRLGIADPLKNLIPEVNFTEQRLKKLSKDYILILGISMTEDGDKLTLNKMRSRFGWDPEKSEPCFYNQDWYLKEKFADKEYLKFQWYLVNKKVAPETRGRNPKDIENKFSADRNFPTAILTAYIFFAYYFLNNKKLLWKHDFIWCSDKDENGDQIYTGRYTDPKRINKNGFNIHRRLSIRSCYGAAVQIIK